MLKITTETRDGRTVLRLEGKLMAAWIDELLEAQQRARASGRPVALDLAHVSFVDAPATATLRELVRQGLTLQSSSPFIAELLKEDVA